MPTTNASGPSGHVRPTYARGNLLLSRLPEVEFEAMRPKLEQVCLSRLEPLYEQHQRIKFIYFPLSCVASVVQVMRDGQIVEAATIGNEGAVGLTVVHGSELSIGRVAAQVPGETYRIEARTVREMARPGTALQDTVQRSLLAFLFQVMQSVACNQLHSATQRYCRWLLMMDDRTPSAELAITQEFLGEMLGVRRETVAQVASEFQRDGVIRYRRGVVTILDRGALEARACECYATVRAEHERLLGAPISGREASGS